MSSSNKPTSVFVAALLLAALSRNVRAERAIGLEAQGVDPLVALHNPQGLDVRDALGRPVSAAVIAQELGLAARGRATLASFASALPKARLFAALVEFFSAAPLSALSSPGPLSAARRIFSAAPTAQPEPKLLLLLLAAFLPAAASAAWSSAAAAPIAVKRSHRKIAALRI